jgi:pimeloyl-ACP methyl ester carboxylesterase
VAADHTAVVLPGGRYGPYTPLLMYAADAAEARGARIQPVSWSRPDEPPTLEPVERAPWVREEAEPALDEAGPGALLIAKSLGTYAALLAADRDLPAVWLTPVLIEPAIVDALRRATAPFLLVGGTADRLWDGDLARTLTPHLLEVPGADHGMYVEGPLARSVEVLGRVVTAVEHFLDDVVWPE